jgi:hypothetical protein
MNTIYDPPSGWKFGFPKIYKPTPGETLEDTLIRDGYPEKDVAVGAKHCRFWEEREAA